MSGGFFRGTSADQDTRFSNKQAKLMKSQKFPPELENLVDMTKVKIDVLKPWIAKRVTELIGFEDEVLINFIYGLLEGEAVNGKQVQISLTGFMERNTGKFMKELWTLLLSAQQNVSGVPQQFLDAKEEETKKKKAETDRIANEIHRKKEKEMQEFHEERAKMDGDGAKSRENHSELEPNVKHDARGSTIQQADEKERYKRNGRRRNSRGSRSPDSPYHSPSPRHKRAVSPSKSDSRSYSNDRRRSRSISGAPPSRSRSISSERRERSPPRRSMIHHRRHDVRRSPSPWRRPHLKRRSRSHSRRRSPSPVRYRVRSPRRHRSRSPLRRRSQSPVRRRSRSPVRRKSRTPIQRSPVQYKSRMPLRRRSPSPVHSRSPSPIRGRSPVHRRSPSPVHRRSRSPLRRHSPSPHHQSPPARRRYRRSLSNSPHQSMSPARRRPSMHGRKRSFSPVSRRSPVPQESSSPSHNRRSSISPVRKESPKRTRSPIQSPVERARHEKYSPAARRTSPSERAEVHSGNRKGTKSAERRPVVSLRSPQRDVKDQSDLVEKPRNLSPSLQKSPSGSDASRGRSYSEEQRSISPRDSPHKRRGRMVLPESPNPSRQAADPKTRRDNSGTVVDDENNLSSRDIGRYKSRSSGKSSLMPVRDKGSLETVDTYALADSTKSKEPQLTNSDRIHDTDHKEHRERLALSTITKTTDVSMKSREYHDAPRAKDKKIPRTDDDDKSGYQNPNAEGLPKLSRKSEQYNKNGSSDSPLKDADGHVDKVKEKRKLRKSDRQDAESDDFSSYDSHEDRKENKKRRREEKKLKKEMRRRRREEKRRRRGERRAEKQKLKSGDASSSSSDLEGDHSEDESVKRRELRASNFEETESEQKRLEIELREKALKSLRARKGSGN